MRTYILSTVILALAATPAFAIIGGGHGNGGGGPDTKYAFLNVVNGSDTGVEVSIDGGAFVALEPGEGAPATYVASKKLEATITARLLSAPGISSTATAQLQANKTTVATVSASSSAVSIAVARPGNVARHIREAGVALASTGGLLPLLWLGLLLGRRPQRRQRPEACNLVA